VERLAGLIETVEGFEWDAGNSEKNWTRHQVTQSECEQVFANQPLVLSGTAKAGAVEARYFALGRTDAARELAIVFTVRSKRVRVISVHTRAVDPRRMKRGRLRTGVGTEVGQAIGATSPYVSWTRSPTSTPYCVPRSPTGERAS
jgi:hypothetical protein